MHGLTANRDVRQAVIQRQEKRGADEESDIENRRRQHKTSQPDLIVYNMAPSRASLSAWHGHDVRCFCHDCSCRRASCGRVRRVPGTLVHSDTTIARDRLDATMRSIPPTVNVLGEGADMQQRALFSMRRRPPGEAGDAFLLALLAALCHNGTGHGVAVRGKLEKGGRWRS